MARGEAAGKTAVTRGTTTDSVTVRKCEALEEMQACCALQKEVWNFSDAELVPVRMFVLATKIGGHVIGAFDGREMIGFAVAFPGMRGGHSYLHSHMLAVRQQYRNAGLGRRMKFFQREDALASGFDLMEWTFDPLEIKNAYLNIEKLGAIARRYNVNQYGITSSPLQGGLPSDRLVAEWWMKSERVTALLNGKGMPKFGRRMCVEVPSQIYEWKASAATRTRALEVQKHNQEQLMKAFAEGLSVLGYERDRSGDGRFVLGKWTELLNY
jgi:predicted GNAT superfamily acetyltransferase